MEVAAIVILLDQDTVSVVMLICMFQKLGRGHECIDGSAYLEMDWRVIPE
jgi:hypothetical protein